MTKPSEVTPAERRALFPDIQEAHLVVPDVTRTMLREILGSRKSDADAEHEEMMRMRSFQSHPPKTREII